MIMHNGKMTEKGEFTPMMSEEGMRIKALKEFGDKDELYQVVDFLNKALKDKDLIFGIKKQGDKQIITIYET